MKVFAFVLFAVVCAVFADDEPTVTDEEVRAVADALKDIQLEDDVIRPHVQTRAWNPLKKISAAFKKSCSCPNGDKCECTFGLPVLKSQGVIGGRLIEGQIELNLNVANVIVVSRKFPLAGKQEVCGRLPKSLSAISVCLTVAALPIPGGVSSCAAADFRINNQIGASVNLQCLDVRGGKLSVGGPANISPAGPVNIDVKPPFGALAKKLNLFS